MHHVPNFCSSSYFNAFHTSFLIVFMCVCVCVRVFRYLVFAFCFSIYREYEWRRKRRYPSNKSVTVYSLSISTPFDIWNSYSCFVQAIVSRTYNTHIHWITSVFHEIRREKRERKHTMLTKQWEKRIDSQQCLSDCLPFACVFICLHYCVYVCMSRKEEESRLASHT